MLDVNLFKVKFFGFSYHGIFASFFSQKELEKQKRIQRSQELEAVAKGHYEKFLLRKKGLEPWKRLRVQSKQNAEVISPSLYQPQLGSMLSSIAWTPVRL